MQGHNSSTISFDATLVWAHVAYTQRIINIQNILIHAIFRKLAYKYWHIYCIYIIQESKVLDKYMQEPIYLIKWETKLRYS
jgi:hypothetical protein